MYNTSSLYLPHALSLSYLWGNGKQKGAWRVIVAVCSEIASRITVPEKNTTFVRTPGGFVCATWERLRVMLSSTASAPTVLLVVSHTNCRFHASASDAHAAAVGVKNNFLDTFRPRQMLPVLVELDDDKGVVTFRDNEGSRHDLSEIPARTLKELYQSVGQIVSGWHVANSFRVPLRLVMALNHPRSRQLHGTDFGNPSMRAGRLECPTAIAVSLNGGVLPEAVSANALVLDEVGQELSRLKHQLGQLAQAAFLGAAEPQLHIVLGYAGDPAISEDRRIARSALLEASQSVFADLPSLPHADNLMVSRLLYNRTTGEYEKP